MHHGIGERSRLRRIHTAQKNSHQHRAQLVVGPGTFGSGVHKSADLLLRQGKPVTLAGNDMLGKQRGHRCVSHAPM